MNTNIVTKCIALVIVVSSIATPAAAAVGVDVSTSYEGVSGDSQAIRVTATITPQDAKMTDVTIRVAETGSTLLDEGTFSKSVTPGSADTTVTYEGNGVFHVDELEPGEAVTISFTVYPKSIKQASVSAASITVDYVQNGQTLSRSETVQADLSSSSWFALQQTESTLQRQKMLAYAGGGVLALAVLGGAVVTYRRLVDSSGPAELEAAGDDPF